MDAPYSALNKNPKGGLFTKEGSTRFMIINTVLLYLDKRSSGRKEKGKDPEKDVFESSIFESSIFESSKSKRNQL